MMSKHFSKRSKNKNAAKRNRRRAGNDSRRSSLRRTSLNMESLEDRIVLASDWQNSINRFDVDDNPAAAFDVVPLDALIVINELNNQMHSSSVDGKLTEITAADPIPTAFFDVTGDGLVTPLDALQVINRLNIDFNGSNDPFVASNQIVSDTTALDSMINPTATAAVNNPAIATGGNQAVAVWEQYDEANSSWSIFAQRFDASGVKVGDAIQIIGGSDMSSRHPVVAVNSAGDFAIAWQIETIDGDWDIAAATYAADGIAIRSFLSMNDFVSGNQTNPDVTFTSNDTFAVVWEGAGLDDHNGIYERIDNITGDRTGDALLGETRVNPQVTHKQSNPDIAATSDGRTIVTWHSSEVAILDTDVTGFDGVFARASGGGNWFLGLGGNDPAVAVAADDTTSFVWNSTDGGIIGTTISGNEVKNPSLLLDFTGLESLGETQNYEAWVIVDGQPVSAGVFDIDSDGDPVDENGDPAVFTSRAGATTVVISIEPELDLDTQPSNTKILAGELDSFGQVALTIEHPAALNTDFFEATGEYIIATPTTVTTADQLSGVWFLNIDGAVGDGINGLDLPTLPVGWEYEGWAVIDGQPVSTGRFTDVNSTDDFSGFSGTEATPNVPGEDFITNAPDGLTFPTDLSGATIVVSVEPEPDNSPAPFTLKPLSGQVPDPATTGTNFAMTNGFAVTNGIPISGTGIISQPSLTTSFVSISTAETVSGAEIIAVPGGGFVTSWSGFADRSATAQSDLRVFIREIKANGFPAGDAVALNNGTFLDNGGSEVALLGDQYVTTWQGRGNDATGAFARLTPSTIFVASKPFQLNAISDLTLNESSGDLVTYFVVPTVVDQDNTVDNPIFTLQTDFPGASIDSATGIVSIPLPETSGGTDYDMTITATDGDFAESQTFNVSVTDVNDPPALAEIADQSTNIRDLFSLQFAAAVDSDVPVDTVSHTVTLADGSDLPSWLSFSPDNLTIFGTPSARHIGVINLLVTATDGMDSSTESFALTINEPFEMQPISDATVAADVSSLEILAAIRDLDSGADSPFFTVTTDAPEGATIDPTTGMLTVPVSEAMRGNSYSVTVTADDRDFADSTTFTMTVEAAA